MRKLMVMVLAMVIAIGLTGCATGPETALRPKSLKGDHVVYFEQSDRIPKDVLLEINKQPEVAGVNAAAGVPVEDIVEKVIEEIFKVAPEMAESYSKERMNNALIGRRMLFRGYESPEQLKEINEIIKSMGIAIEKITPEK